MKETIIRKKFGQISAAFFNWQSAMLIVTNRKPCLEMAQRVFNNEKKIEAILDIALFVHTMGYPSIMESLQIHGPDYLRKLPYMGPVTSRHLAKNLGLPVAKADRHLKRILSMTNFQSVDDMCSEISRITGDKVSVVDIVFWRYATLKTDYSNFFIDFSN